MQRDKKTEKVSLLRFFELAGRVDRLEGEVVFLRTKLDMVCSVLELLTEMSLVVDQVYKDDDQALHLQDRASDSS